MADENAQQKDNQKPPRTPEQVKKAVLGELKEARLKELKSKIKQQAQELNDAKAIVSAKESKIEETFEEYSDVFEG